MTRGAATNDPPGSPEIEVGHAQARPEINRDVETASSHINVRHTNLYDLRTHKLCRTIDISNEKWYHGNVAHVSFLDTPLQTGTLRVKSCSIQSVAERSAFSSRTKCIEVVCHRSVQDKA